MAIHAANIESALVTLIFSSDRVVELLENVTGLVVCTKIKSYLLLLLLLLVR